MKKYEPTMNSCKRAMNRDLDCFTVFHSAFTAGSELALVQSIAHSQLSSQNLCPEQAALPSVVCRRLCICTVCLHAYL